MRNSHVSQEAQNSLALSCNPPEASVIRISIETPFPIIKATEITNSFSKHYIK